MKFLLLLVSLPVLVTCLPIGQTASASLQGLQAREPEPQGTTLIPNIETRDTPNPSAAVEKREPWVPPRYRAFRIKWRPLRGYYKKRSEGSFRHDESAIVKRSAAPPDFARLLQLWRQALDRLKNYSNKDGSKGSNNTGARKGPYRPYYAKRSASAEAIPDAANNYSNKDGSKNNGNTGARKGPYRPYYTKRSASAETIPDGSECFEEADVGGEDC